jgi:hypothetical protein
LHQLQLVLVAGEHLRAGVCVHGVFHNDGIFVWGVKVSTWLMLMQAPPLSWGGG